MIDEWERARIARDARRPETRDAGARGSAAFVGKVLSTGANLGVGLFAKMQVTRIFGAEAEGGTGTGTPSASSETVLVYMLGPASPSTGDLLNCHYEGNRWVAQRAVSVGGYSGYFGSIPFCFCSPIPAILKMVSRDHGCNFGMFQDATIEFQPRPAHFDPLHLPDDIYISNEDFPDPFATGARFVYYLTCQYNQFNLSRLYYPAGGLAPPGQPYQDGILYSWLLGGYENTCNPFHLDYGTAFAGSDASCFVTIDEVGP